MKAIVLLVSASNRQEAMSLARLLLSARKAACVTILPSVTSVYRWKGRVETSKECVLLIKTIARHFASVEKLVRQKHSYEVPEIVALQASRVSAPYLAWIRESVS